MEIVIEKEEHLPELAHIVQKSNPRFIHNSIKERILTELIEPSYYSDIDCLIRNRQRWRICGHVFETLSKIMIACSSILSFSSGFYNSSTFGFFAGCTSTISLACVQFASYCFKESKDSGVNINSLLKKINIDILPEYGDKIDSSK